jgi:hypothetical protein
MVEPLLEARELTRAGGRVRPRRGGNFTTYPSDVAGRGRALLGVGA